MAEVRFLPPAAKYLKKLKDKNLKQKYKDAILSLCENPYAGTKKKGDLSGIYGYDMFYDGTNYELAYTVETTESDETIVVIMAGTRENFYDQLKRYIK